MKKIAFNGLHLFKTVVEYIYQMEKEEKHYGICSRNTRS